VFTEEMAYAMGGREGRDFKKFLDLSSQAYNILRRHAHTLINL
jgi:phosphatidylinositol-4,5-bisphosphate 3-kinase